MKNSRLFLGLTTICLATAGIVAAKTKAPATHTVWTKANASAPCNSASRMIQAYTSNGSSISPTVFTAPGCANHWKYNAGGGE